MSELPVLSGRGSRLLVGLVLAVAVAAAVVALIVAAPHPHQRDDSARGTAEKFVDAANNSDAHTLYDLWCRSGPFVDHTPGSFGADNGVSLDTVGEPRNGTVLVQVTLHNDSGDDHQQLTVRQHDGQWCVGP